MSQNPPDNPFGSQPPENDPFGKPPEESGPQSAADIWRAAEQQRQEQQRRQQYPPPPPPPPPPPGPLPPPQGPYGGPPVGAQKADGAITALVLGILGIVICQLCAPFAWSLGRKAERQVDASGGTLGGRGEATAGKILGIIGTIFLVLILLFVIVFVVGFATLDGGSTVTTLEEF